MNHTILSSILFMVFSSSAFAQANIALNPNIQTKLVTTELTDQNEDMKVLSKINGSDSAKLRSLAAKSSCAKASFYSIELAKYDTTFAAKIGLLIASARQYATTGDLVDKTKRPGDFSYLHLNRPYLDLSAYQNLTLEVWASGGVSGLDKLESFRSVYWDIFVFAPGDNFPLARLTIHDKSCSILDAVSSFADAI